MHRIDKDTSGIVIYAKTPEAHRNISMQFTERTVKKTYHCLVNGHPAWDNFTVDLPLLPDGDDRHRTVINKKFGKPSVTYLEVIGNCGPYSWIKAFPKTGRTHQSEHIFSPRDFRLYATRFIQGIKNLSGLATSSENGTEMFTKNARF